MLGCLIMGSETKILKNLQTANTQERGPGKQESFKLRMEPRTPKFQEGAAQKTKSHLAQVTTILSKV